MVEETGAEGRTVWHCEVFDGMVEWLGRVEGLDG